MTDPPAAAVPASRLQWRIWFDAQTQADPCAYSVAAAYRIPLALEPELLARALEREIAAHAELHYDFDIVAGSLVKLPRAERVAVDVLQAPDERGAVALLQRYVRVPIDPARGPKARAAVISFDAGRLLVLCCHHLVCDGASLDVLLDGTSRRLAADDGRPAAVERVYERTAQPLDAGAAAPAAHRPKLGAPAMLPSDGARAAPAGAGESISLVLDERARAAVRGIVARYRVAPFCVVVAAFALLVRACGGDGPVVASFPVTLRRSPESASAVGPFLTYVTLALDANRGSTVRAFVADVWAGVLGAIADPERSGADLLQSGRPEYRAYSLSYMTMPDRRLGAVEAQRFELELETSKFALTLGLVERDAGLRLCAQFAHRAFTAAAARRYLALAAAAIVALDGAAEGERVADLAARLNAPPA